MDDNERIIKIVVIEQLDKLNIDSRMAVIEEKVKRLEAVIFYVMGIAGGGVITAIMALIIK